MDDLWIYRPLRRPDAKLLLVCFAHAGGAASTYRTWPSGLSDDVEVIGLHLPGRAHRVREKPIRTMEGLVDAVVTALRPHLDRPFVLFGHSMGAVLAFESAHELRERHAAAPLHLIVSGRRPPGMPADEPPLHRLDDDAFVREIDARYGGIPAEVRRHADLMALLLPGLRADIAALETHVPAAREALTTAISAFGGIGDRLTPHSHLMAWRTQTTGAFDVRQFDGDHFYVDSQRGAVLAALSAVLEPLLVTARSGAVVA